MNSKLLYNHKTAQTKVKLNNNKKKFNMLDKEMKDKLINKLLYFMDLLD